MEWVALANWILLAAVALPAAQVPLPALGGQAACAVGGLATIIVFVVTGAAVWAWIAFGLACVATLLAIEGAYTLVQDSAFTLQTAGQNRTERSAGLEGLELPFFATAALLSIAVAIG